jgi:hypothetical protein
MWEQVVMVFFSLLSFRSASSRRTGARKFFAGRLVAGLLGAALLLQVLSCGGPSIQEALQDPSRSLQVVIRSEPSGAEVYGVKHDEPGTLLGTTPFTCSYMVTNTPNRPQLWSSVPLGETIVGDWSIFHAGGESSY